MPDSGSLFFVAAATAFAVLANTTGGAQNFKRQTIQVDETGGIFLIVDIVGAEGGQIFAVEAVWAFYADISAGTFVQFNSYGTGNILLSDVDKGVESVFKRQPPLAVIDQISIFMSNNFFIMESISIDGDGFQRLMRGVKNGSARILIDAAALHADQTVFYDIINANTIGGAILV